MKTIIASAIVLLFSLNCMASEKIKAGFKADKQSGQLPITVLFEGMDQAPGTFFSWDFGNGSTSVRKATTALFVNPGTYTVKLVVDNGVETDSSFMSIEVLPNPDLMKQFRAKALAAE